MQRTLDLRCLSSTDLDKTISEYFPISNTTTNNNMQPKTIINEKIIINNSDSYLKIVSKDSITIGKFQLCHNPVLKHNGMAIFNGYTITSNYCAKYCEKCYCRIDNADIYVMNESEYKKIASELNNILLFLNKMFDILLDNSKKGILPAINKAYKVNRPNKDKFLKLKITDSFIKKNKNVKLSDIYKNSLTKYYKAVEDYNSIYENTKNLIGKYYISNFGVGEITDVENNNSIQIICSISEIRKFSIRHWNSILWFEAYEISANDYNNIITQINQIKSIYNNLSKI